MRKKMELGTERGPELSYCKMGYGWPKGWFKLLRHTPAATHTCRWTHPWLQEMSDDRESWGVLPFRYADSVKKRMRFIKTSN